LKPNKSGWWWLYDENRLGWEIVLVQETWPGNFLFEQMGSLRETNVNDYNSWGESISEPNVGLEPARKEQGKHGND
jgi:hypothetical protein